MSNPLVSIIIPNYNNSKFIEQCITSVLNQTYINLEVIVVDDLSTDNSRDIIEKISMNDSRVKKVFLNKNGGVSHARNVGLNYANGTYLTCLDGDDYYFSSTKIQNEINVLLNSKNDLLISFSKIIYVDEDGNQIISKNERPIIKNEGRIFNKLIFEIRSKYIPRDYLYSKKIFLMTLGYDENRNLFEDFDYLLNLSLFVKFHYTNEPGTAYRQKSYGLSKRTKTEISATKNEIIKKYLFKINFLKRIYVCLIKIAIKVAIYLKHKIIRNLKQ